MRYVIDGKVFYNISYGELEGIKSGLKVGIPKVLISCFGELLDMKGEVLLWEDALRLCSPRTTKVYCQHQFCQLRKKLILLGVHNKIILTVREVGVQINPEITVTYEYIAGDPLLESMMILALPKK